MWEQTVHAGLLRGWIKNQFGLSVFVRHRGVMFDGYTAKWLVLRRHAILKDAIVCSIRDSQQTESSDE